jgi:DNA gyrase subunit A
MFASSNHQNLLIFTDTGRVFPLKVFRLPEGGRYARGKPIVNLIQLEGKEKVQAVLPVREFSEGHYLLFSTRRGMIKKTDVMAYSKVRSTGIRAVDIREGDDLVGVRLLEEEDAHVMLTTRAGKAIRFKNSDVRCVGRVACGVRGIRLAEGDEVVSMDILDPEKDVLAVTLNGFGKRSAASEYRTTKRGGKGIVTILTTKRNGLVVGSLQVGDDDQVLMVTDGATMIRFRASDLRTMGRYTQGVRLVRLKKGEQVVAIERLMDVDDDDEDLTSIDGEVLDDDDATASAMAAEEADEVDEVDDDDAESADDDDVTASAMAAEETDEVDEVDDDDAESADDDDAESADDGDDDQE